MVVFELNKAVMHGTAEINVVELSWMVHAKKCHMDIRASGVGLTKEQ